MLIRPGLCENATQDFITTEDDLKDDFCNGNRRNEKNSKLWGRLEIG